MNPEQGPEQQGAIGTWQTIRLELPDFLEEIRDLTTTILGTAVTTLQVISSVLDVLKVFATGLLNPLEAILNALKAKIAKFLQDIRQAGIYLHGDFYSLEGPDFPALRGGFDQYEARMMARLTDRSDPLRPDFSSDSAALAIFFYVSAEVRNIHRILQLLQQIAALFGRRPPTSASQVQVTNLQATYGYEGSTIFSYNKGFFKGFLPRTQVNDNLLSPYNAVNLTWKMAGSPGSPLDVPQVPPAGFIVEFSTVREPLPILCDRPADGVVEGMSLPFVGSGRVVVPCEDTMGIPIYLTGGIDSVDVPASLEFNASVGLFGDLSSDAVRVFAVRSLADPAPIQLSDLKEGDRYYLQRTFFVPFAQNLFFPGKGFGATFQYKDLPYGAEWELAGNRVKRVRDDKQPDIYFVRVRAVSKIIQSPEGFRYEVDNTGLRSTPAQISLREGVQPSDRGPASTPLELLFPDASTEKYLRAVAEALAVLVLCRTDLPVFLGKTGVLDYPGTAVARDGRVPVYWADFEGCARLATGLEDLAEIFLPQLLGRKEPSAYFADAQVSPPVFRSRLFSACIGTTNRLFLKGRPSLEARQLAVNMAEALLNFRVSFTAGSYVVTTEPDQPGQSLLELLAESDLPEGLALGPESLGISGERAAAVVAASTSSEGILPRRPHFFFAAKASRGSADRSPVLYKRTGRNIERIDYVRNLVSGEMYESARFVLQLATAPVMRPKENGWIAFRLFPQGFPSADRFFDKILALIDSLQAAGNSIADTILGYIEFIQGRIAQLQALINQLQTLLDQILRFFAALSPAAGLVVTGFGTDGILTALLSAQNKPRTPPDPMRAAYGGGVVLVAGGLPAPVISLIQALVQAT